MISPGRIGRPLAEAGPSDFPGRKPASAPAADFVSWLNAFIDGGGATNNAEFARFNPSLAYR